MKKALFLFAILSVSFANIANAQGADPKRANQFISDGNFEAALEEYLELLEHEPEDAKFNYRVGVCYLNTNIDKSKAVPYLEKALLDSKADNNTYYLLGRAYHYANDFSKAIKMFKKYLEYGGGTAAHSSDVNVQIQYCENAKELMKFAVNVKFENLGPNVNSVFADYYPFVPQDESFVVFNSKREGNESKPLPNGNFTSNIYYANESEGTFSKANAIKNKINTEIGNEEVIGLSASGSEILIYDENEAMSGDIYLAELRDANIVDPVRLEESINSKEHEIAACISADGSELYFASTRKGGYGGTDLYVSKKLPIGGWGPPQNMGGEINTAMDEDFPNLSPDGKTLFFSSTGHTSMGGYDIFKAKYDPSVKNFGNVQNIGYPINTTMDDMNFRLSKSGKFAYMAALRPEGKGNLDIYRVSFEDLEPQYTVIRGALTCADSTKQCTEAFITVTNLENQDIYGDYMPNFNTMRYIMILPPGNYNVFVDATGFKPISRDIKILDKGSFKAVIEEDIKLESAQ